MRQGVKSASDGRNHMNKWMKICSCLVTVRNYKHFHVIGMNMEGNGAVKFGKLGHKSSVIYSKEFGPYPCS